VELADAMNDEFPVGKVRLLVTFNEAPGVTEGIVVILAEDMVTGTVTLTDAVETPTEGTVTTFVPDEGGLEVTLVDGPGILADGCGMLLIMGTVVLAEAGGIDDEAPMLGVKLGAAGTEEFADGTILPVGNTAELGIGKGVRRPSELVPIDLEIDETFKLRLGVPLGSAGTDALADGTMLPLLGTGRELDDGIGKGVRRPSELVPIDLEIEEIFMLKLGVTLGTAGTEKFADGTILPVGNTAELGIGKGVRRPSELVPIDLEIDETFKLRLGVPLGSAGTDALADGTMLPLLGAERELDDGIGKGVRSPSELVPIDLEVDETFKLRLGVPLGSTGTEEFAEGNMTLLLACNVVDEAFALDNIVETTGNLELEISGADEFADGMVDEDGELGTGVDIGIEEFPDGGMIPLLPVADDVAVLPWIVKVIPPLVREIWTLGVATSLPELLVVEFPEDGGIRPDAPVEEAVAVDPDTEKISIPEEIVTFGKVSDVERGGGISPDEPVELMNAVRRDVENTALPEDTFTLVITSVKGGGIKPCELIIVVVIVDVKILETTAVPPGGVLCDGVLEAGGTSPSPRVEFAVNVLLPMVKFALPRETVRITLTGLLGVELGGISPFPPSLRLVAVNPDRVKFAEPVDTVATSTVEGAIIPPDAVELNVLVDPDTVKLLPPDDARTIVEPIETGGIKPWLPVEASVSVDPEAENRALPTLMMVVVLTY
jgi:hypothetical protein